MTSANIRGALSRNKPIRRVDTVREPEKDKPGLDLSELSEYVMSGRIAPLGYPGGQQGQPLIDQTS